MATGTRTVLNKSPEQEMKATTVDTERPDPQTIAELAYSYWTARGCPDGSVEEDWFRAEAELQASSGPESDADRSHDRANEALGGSGNEYRSKSRHATAG